MGMARDILVAQPGLTKEVINFVAGQDKVVVYFDQGYIELSTGGLEDGTTKTVETFRSVVQDTVTIDGENYTELLAADDKGKEKGKFRTDDVLAMADKLRGK